MTDEQVKMLLERIEAQDRRIAELEKSAAQKPADTAPAPAVAAVPAPAAAPTKPSPAGWAEKAIITLGDGRETYAIYLHGLTGRVEVKDGEPRDPDDHLLRNAKGEDEAER